MNQPDATPIGDDGTPFVPPLKGEQGDGELNPGDQPEPDPAALAAELEAQRQLEAEQQNGES